MAGYNHIGWACPYFKWDAKGLVKCEAGRIVFPDREAEKAWRDGTGVPWPHL